jgi:nucleolar pre-ribosomal-associated protein 1
VHHFLLAVCSHPGIGLCFKDRGWYPRDPDGDAGVVQEIQSEDATSRPGGRIHNKILANVLKGLKVNEDPRQQELALKILTACPELVSRLVLYCDYMMSLFIIYSSDTGLQDP